MLIFTVTKVISLAALMMVNIPQANSIPLDNGNICSHTSDFGKNFTGVIVQYQASMEVPPQNHARITRCLEGKKRAYDAFSPIRYDSDIAWGKKICTAQKNQKSVCYMLARREVTSHRKVSVFTPGEWVGGVFMCPGSLPDDVKECQNDNAVPLWPLVATNFTHFEEVVRSTQIVRVPYLISYDMENRKDNLYQPATDIPENWADFIDVTEDYSEGRAERSVNRVVWDLALGSIRLALKSFHHIAFIKSTATFKDKGDEDGPRRSAQYLDPKVTFEEYPEAFLSAPDDNYLDDGYDQKVKREMRNEDKLDIERTMSSENYLRFLYSADYDNNDYEYEMIGQNKNYGAGIMDDYDKPSQFSDQNSDFISVQAASRKGSAIPINLGYLVRLSVEVPLYTFNYILKTVYAATTLTKDEMLGYAVFKHPSEFLNPSTVLDSINRRRLPNRFRIKEANEGNEENKYEK